MQLVAVLVPDAGKELAPHTLRRANGVQKAGDKAHVAHFQNEIPVQQLQALNGQAHRLGGHGVIHRADALQAHLVDLFKGVAFLARAVDVFRVIEPSAAARLHLGILGNGKGHVRLEGQ